MIMSNFVTQLSLGKLDDKYPNHITDQNKTSKEVLS